jgi:signal transduction histidine kinase/streptogramin lyase
MKIVRSLLISMLSLFLVATCRALNPKNHITQYAHTAWRLQDGFFNGAPTAIAQTKDGYLWMGTESGGLFRFDGVRFVLWTPPEGAKLVNSRSIDTLFAASDGSLWIGGSVLARFKDGNLTEYPNIRGHFNSILEDRNGAIWIARSRVYDGAGPLCKVAGAKLRCYGKADGIPYTNASPLVEDLQGGLWVAGGSQLTHWTAGSPITYALQQLKSSEGLVGFSSLAAEPDGVLWVGIDRHGPGMGLQQFRQGAWKPFSSPDLDGSTLEVTSLLLDRNNSLWVGTESSGIYRIRGEEVDRFSSADGLSSDDVNSMYEDHEGNIWVATSNGIDSFHDLSVASYSKREGLGADQAQSVLVARDMTVWIGNLDSLDSLRADTFTSIRDQAGFPGHTVTSLFEDHDGLLWVGVDDGLYVYESGKFRPIRRPDGTQIGVIYAFTEDTDHNIWVETIGQRENLVRIQNRMVREEISAPQIPEAGLLAADPISGIWLGLDSGALARYRHGQIETFSTFGGDRRIAIGSLLVNPDGSIFGGSSSGLMEWRSGRIQILTTRNGIPCHRIYGAISDSSGSVWLYTQCGLIQISKAELDRWWEHPETSVKFRLFDALDGVRASGANFQPRASLSSDGRLWFANGNIVQMIDPGHLAVNPIVPPVHIESATVDGKNYSIRENLRLPALTRNLEIDYTALSFVLPQRVRFRYRLDGHDTQWQEPGTRRQAFYTDLKPGRYRFRVIACNNDGLWNDTGATLGFSITPAWFQTTWFLVLCVAAGLLILWGFYHIRVRQVAKAIGARFDERVAERTRIARDLHDTFLQTIQGSKLVADDALDPSTDPVRMRRAMEQLSVWLGRATEEGRAALNSLRTSTTEMNDLAAAFRRAIEECSIPNSMEASFAVVGRVRKMHPIVRDEVYRIGYEAIRNACAHSQASHVQVELIYAEDLTLRVSDSGVGIDPSITAQGKEGHFGLQGMRERAARIVGKLTIVSSAASGTKVALVVPGGIIYRKTVGGGLSLGARIKSLLKRGVRTSNQVDTDH